MCDIIYATIAQLKQSLELPNADILNISLSILLQRKQPSIFGRLILSQENKYKPDVPEPRGLCAQSTSNKRHSIIRKSFLFSEAMNPVLLTVILWVTKNQVNHA